MSLPTVQSVGEHALIERLRRRAGAPPPWVTLGIGDDAAVILPARGTVDVVTTDSLVEGVHFRRDWSHASAVGHKALAVNLSDLAAMGATPRAALLSLALPADFAVNDFDALLDGFLALGVREGMPLVGGNLSRSPGPLIVDVTAIGAAHPRKLLKRSGGRPGDIVYVTGSVGGAAAGLAHLDAGHDRAHLDEPARACVARYERPEARLTCGVQIARNRAASACIDLSDGLADAARQLGEASGAGIVIDADAVPVDPGAVAWAHQTGALALDFALAGGEDYELLFAVSPRRRRAFHAIVGRCRGLALTAIGHLQQAPGAWLKRAGRLEPLSGGFTHF